MPKKIWGGPKPRVSIILEKDICSSYAPIEIVASARGQKTQIVLTLHQSPIINYQSLWTMILNVKCPLSLLFVPVASFLMTLAVFLLLIPLLLSTYAEEKVFLVETETVKPVIDTLGKDYASSNIGESYYGMANCKYFCREGICVKRKDVKQNAWTKSFECQTNPTPPTPIYHPPPPTNAATMPITSCLKTPLKEKGNQNRLGFRVMHLRGRSNFCCIQGPKTGQFVKTPRCCKGRGRLC